MERRRESLKEKAGYGFGRILLLLCVLVSLFGISVQAAEDHKIEQVYINMPDVIAYYRAPDNSGEIEGYLGGEKLQLQDLKKFSETGESAEYYILLDISASIRKSRFEEIKSALTEFLQNMRGDDSMVLITFGDAVQNVLNGTETRDAAAATISQLENNNQNTLLFEAIDAAAEQMVKAGDSTEKRRVMVVISDGKDCADDTRSIESVGSGLTAKGIPLYTIAVENNEGDSETEISNYQGKFGALSRNTGGIPWTVGEDRSVLDGLNQIQETLFHSFRAEFRAESNKVSNKKEDFVLKFVDENNRTETCSVLVSRGQEDHNLPKVTSVTVSSTNSIDVVYSEKVLNAADTGNYRLTRDGKAIPVSQVAVSEENPYTYTLVFENDFLTGEYQLKISGVTDDSNEQNALANPEKNFHIDGITETETQKITEKQTEKQTQKVTEKETESETEAEEKGFVDQLLDHWYIIVIVVVFLAALIVIIVVLVKKSKKTEEPMYEPSERISEVDMDLRPANSRHHVKVNPMLPSKKIIMWISNGTDAPKEMEVTINGSCIVGRSGQCDVCCDDPMMSRQHFALEVEGDNVFITDLQTRNGTSVNGVAIREKYRLESRDEIAAGNLKFRVEWR